MEVAIAEHFFNVDKCLSLWEALVWLRDYMFELQGSNDLTKEHFQILPDVVYRHLQQQIVSAGGGQLLHESLEAETWHYKAPAQTQTQPKEFPTLMAEQAIPVPMPVIVPAVAAAAAPKRR